MSKKIIILSIIVLLLGLSIFFLQIGDIDENKFCEYKVKKEFPEHNYTRIGISVSQTTCIAKKIVSVGGDYTTRDGLSLINTNEHTSIETLYFKINNQEDLDYLKSDDTTKIIRVILYIIMIFFMFLLISIITDDGGALNGKTRKTKEN